MLGRALARMPHAGRMRLIGEIVSADARTIRCLATDHRAPSHPLRFGGRLFSCALVELGAQAAAAHTSLFGIGSAHAGLMLSLTDVVVGPDLVATDERLAVRAELLESLDAMARYRFEVTAGGERLVAADVMLAMQRRAG